MDLSTSYKPKISKHRSFAIGARDLSAALSGIPQNGTLQLAFWPGRQDKDGAHYVMSFEYVHIPEVGMGPAWTVNVRAIPRGLKHRIKTILIEHALPQIAIPWLVARADLFGRAGAEVLELMFDEQENRLFGRPGSTRKKLEPKLVQRKNAHARTAEEPSK